MTAPALFPEFVPTQPTPASPPTDHRPSPTSRAQPLSEALKGDSGRRLDRGTMNILHRITYEGENVAILNEPQLARPVYEGVADVLNRLRGQWRTAVEGFVFPFNPRPLIESVLRTGRMPPKNPLALFPTPRPVGEAMLDLAGRFPLTVRPTRVLEPSAGVGGLADLIMDVAPETDLHLVELDELNVALLRDKGYEVHHGDFLTYQLPAEPFDFIFMNPPFSVEGDRLAYITHIERAVAIARPWTTVVAVCPPGFLRGRSSREQSFRQLVADRGDYRPLPDESFAESGTGVSTCLVRINGTAELTARREWNGWPSRHAWAAALYIDNKEEWQQRAFDIARTCKRDLLGRPRADGRAAFDELFAEVLRWGIGVGDLMFLDAADRQRVMAYYLSQIEEARLDM